MSENYVRHCTNISILAKPWLVVFDNVDNLRHLKDFWPSGGGGHIIMTSRTPYLAEFRGSIPLELSPLSLDESKELFYKIVGEDKKSQHSREIDDLLAEWRGVPLALFHIGSFIRRGRMSLPRFLRIYRNSAANIYRAENTTDEYPHSIATAFSIGELETNAKDLLRLLCYFDPDRIPDDLLLSSFEDGKTLFQMETEYE